MESRESFNKLLKDVTNQMTNSVSFVNSYMKDKHGQAFEKATAKNYIQILTGETLWHNFSFQYKDMIHGLAITQNCKDYDLLLKEAYKMKEKVECFLKQFVYDEIQEVYLVTSRNYDKIIEGVYTWNEFSAEERTAIHTMLIYRQGESFPLLYERALHVKKEVDTFIHQYLLDIKGEQFIKVDCDNYKAILSAEPIWLKKNSLIQEAIDRKLKQPTYEQLLNGSKMLLESTKQFIQAYIMDEEHELYETVTNANYHQILQGRTIWKRMTANQRDIINQFLLMKERKIYEDMLDDAKVLEYEMSSRISV